MIARAAAILMAGVLLAGCDDVSAPTISPAGARATTKPAPPAEQVEARVIHIVSEQVGVNTSELSRKTRLKEDLKTDDLDTIELVMELEDTYQISITDEDAEKFRTIGDLIDHVKSAPKATTKPAGKQAS
jgi:acyl carrier protein